MHQTAVIHVKNKVNWPMALILPIPLIVILLVCLALFFTGILSLSLFSMMSSLLLFLLSAPFFLLFLYLWLWNTFGETVVTISQTTITLSKRRHLFFKTKAYQISDITSIYSENRDVDLKGFLARNNYIISKELQTVGITLDSSAKITLFTWLSKRKAKEIIVKINDIAKINSNTEQSGF